MAQGFFACKTLMVASFFFSSFAPTLKMQGETKLLRDCFTFSICSEAAAILDHIQIEPQRGREQRIS